MTSWIDDKSSEYLYMYDLDTGNYRGKLKMQPAPKWIQGIACFEGNLYVTCDDGDADQNAPDHMYRIDISEDRENGTVIPEKAFDDVIRQGEIEGLTFDKVRRQFLLLYKTEEPESFPECLRVFMRATVRKYTKYLFMILTKTTDPPVSDLYLSIS